MTSARPDVRTVRAALTLAQRAPSVHNTQPWRWVLDEGVLHLQPDMSRWLPAEDPAAVQLVMSCGAVLDHAQVAFAAAGWATTVHPVPDLCHGEHLASITFAPLRGDVPDAGLAVAVERRRSDRRRFSSWPVPASFVDGFLEIARAHGVFARAVGPGAGPASLGPAIVRSAPGPDGTAPPEARDCRGRARRAELWSAVVRHPSGSGIPLASLPERGASPQNRSLPRGQLVGPRPVPDEPDAGVLVVLGTVGADLRAQLAAGRACSAVLLAATAVGLASCPLTRPFDGPLAAGPVQQSEDGPWLFPRLLIRVGWSPASALPVPASPRLPLEQVLTVLSDRPTAVPVSVGWGASSS